MSLKSFAVTSLLASLVAGHGAIISAKGDAGGSGMALGVDTSTPRDGTGRNPFQQDSTRFRGAAADTFGETVGAGANTLEAGTRAIMAETGDSLPQITKGGEVSMVLHQVNGDGGGPYTCSMNADGTGANWTPITVTTTPPGQNSRNRSGAQTDFPLVAAVPANQECTGNVAGQDNVCLVRCENAARAGPFGGVIPVQMAGAAGNATKPAAARRALALAIKRSENLLTEMTKRASSFQGLSPEEIEELREDGEIV